MSSTLQQQQQQQQEARQLRAALDEQLELVRSLSSEEQLESSWSPEEQLAQMIMIVTQYPEGALQQAVLLAHPPVNINNNNSDDWDYSNKTYSGRLPIHLACDTNAPIEIIRWLLEQDPTKESILRKDKWGDLPIHTACSRKDVQVVRLLIESDPDKRTLQTKDHTGALPIHMACRYNAPPEVIRMLLENDKDASSLFVPGIYNQLPIHVACRNNLSTESLQLLLHFDRDKKSLLVRDNADRLPLHVAYLRHNNNNTNQLALYRMLLEAMMVGRVERVGWELWKRDVRQIGTWLALHERDFNAADKLELTRDTLQEFIERAFQLELGIWKASCQRAGMVNCREDCALKRERRIKSGADIIIPRVLSFLEDEPIESLLQQL